MKKNRLSFALIMILAILFTSCNLSMKDLAADKSVSTTTTSTTATAATASTSATSNTTSAVQTTPAATAADEGVTTFEVVVSDPPDEGTTSFEVIVE